jgi:hypothetical protein
MGCASSTAVDQQQAANNDHMEPNYFLPAGTPAALPAAHRDGRGQQQPGGEYRPSRHRSSSPGSWQPKFCLTEWMLCRCRITGRLQSASEAEAARADRCSTQLPEQCTFGWCVAAACY